jgi:NitT/TauT family transport system ATP-binding protein
MAIDLIDISMRFQDKLLFDGLNLSFSEGEIACLTGASGVGKTTLLNLLMGLTKPDSGVIRGMSGKRIAAVFQEDRLIEHFDAVRNIKLVCDYSVSKETIAQELKRVGIEEPCGKEVRLFSGGMRRRVAIIRAIFANGDILLLDEPFKGLDETLKLQVIDYVRGKTKGRTVILVTHDRDEAERLNARVIAL